MRVTTQFLAVLVTLVLLSGGAGVFIVQSVETAARVQREGLEHSAEVSGGTQRLAGLANQEFALILGYFSGSATFAQIDETSEAFELEVKRLLEVLPPESDLRDQINAIRTLEASLYTRTPVPGEATLFELLSKARAARDEALALNERQSASVASHGLAFGDPSTNATIAMILADLLGERVAVLQFEPDMKSTRGLPVGSVNAALAHNAHTFTWARDETARIARATAQALRAFAEAEPRHREEAIDLAARLDARGEAFRQQGFEQVRAGIAATHEGFVRDVTRAEALGVFVPRARVSGVGPNASAIESLVTLADRQAEARRAIGSYVNLTLGVQSLLAGSFEGHPVLRAATAAAVESAREEARRAEREADDNLVRARAGIVIATAAVVIPVGVTGAFVVHRLSSRIRSFDAASRAVARGDFSAPAPPRLRDDFDALSDAWAGMTRSLAERDREIIEKRRELSANLQQKQMFMDILSHDLKNPLAVARARVELLARKRPEAKTELETLERSLDRATRIIEDSLLFSKLESAHAIDLAVRDLAPLLREVIEDVRPLAEAKRVSIRLETPEEAPCFASPLLARAVENVLGNAVKWSPEGGKIEVRVEPRPAGVAIAVVDHGPGIPAEARARVFARFERADRAGVSGTGLGLAIAGRIIALHAGRVGIEETPGGGATFVIDLPTPAEEPSGVVLVPAPPPAAPSEATPER